MFLVWDFRLCWDNTRLIRTGGWVIVKQELCHLKVWKTDIALPVTLEALQKNIKRGGPSLEVTMSPSRRKGKTKPQKRPQVTPVTPTETVKTPPDECLCSTCGKCCLNQIALNSHVKTHVPNPKHCCQHCGRQCSSNGSLRRHERTHTGEKPSKCQDCGKCFARASSLAAHRRIHSGDLPYLCTYCKRSFRQKTSLDDHVRLHRGERPFQCESCGKAFTKKSGLLRHKLIHTGKKPHKCSFCEKAFNQSNTLVDHEKLHTGARPFECEKCGEKFKQKSHLRVHLKRHEKEDAETQINSISPGQEKQAPAQSKQKRTTEKGESSKDVYPNQKQEPKKVVAVLLSSVKEDDEINRASASICTLTEPRESGASEVKLEPMVYILVDMEQDEEQPEEEEQQQQEQQQKVTVKNISQSHSQSTVTVQEIKPGLAEVTPDL